MALEINNPESSAGNFDPLLYAREGKAFVIKGDNKDTLSAGVVQTGAGTFKPIPEGYACVVRGFMIHLHTISDTLAMVIGYTAAADGTGTFVEVSPRLHIETGDKFTGSVPAFIELPVPMYLKYSATCKALAVQLTANDDSAEATFGVSGWLEGI